jgi:glycosyltransferase involved in cell wall biosynthesis
VGIASWPGSLRSWRELKEVRTARRVANAVARDVLEGWVPDVLIERHTLFSDAGWQLHDRFGIPWILEVNAPPLKERSRYEDVVRPDLAARWERAVLQAAPHVVAVSRWLVDWLQADIGCRAVHWVPNGVDPVQGSRLRGRALLGADADEPLLGFVGSAKPWHDLDAAQALARGLGVRLAVVGPTDPGQASPGRLCPGFLQGQDLADAIASFDVGLALYPPAAPDWFSPLKVLAYRAQGTPIVATDTGDVAALVEDGGSVVTAGDLPAATQAVQQWMGQRTERRVRSWTTVAQEVLATLTPSPASCPGTFSAG